MRGPKHWIICHDGSAINLAQAVKLRLGENSDSVGVWVVAEKVGGAVPWLVAEVDSTMAGVQLIEKIVRSEIEVYDVRRSYG